MRDRGEESEREIDWHATGPLKPAGAAKLELVDPVEPVEIKDELGACTLRSLRRFVVSEVSRILWGAWKQELGWANLTRRGFREVLAKHHLQDLVAWTRDWMPWRELIARIRSSTTGEELDPNVRVMGAIHRINQLKDLLRRLKMELGGRRLRPPRDFREFPDERIRYEIVRTKQRIEELEGERDLAQDELYRRKKAIVGETHYV